MCGRKRAERYLLQQQLFQQQLAIQSYQRGCCGSRRANRKGLQYQAPDLSFEQQGFYPATFNRPNNSMAGILAVGIGIGCEKLGRKISEKRSECKEKKAIDQRELIYGHGESSTASAANTKISGHSRRQERKSEEARREKDGIYERRRSVSTERTLLPEDAPPQYEEAVRQGARRV